MVGSMHHRGGRQHPSRLGADARRERQRWAIRHMRDGRARADRRTVEAVQSKMQREAKRGKGMGGGGLKAGDCGEGAMSFDCWLLCCFVCEIHFHLTVGHSCGLVIDDALWGARVSGHPPLSPQTCIM